MSNLTDNMQKLADLIASFPKDVEVEVEVMAKINDDVPPQFVGQSHQSMDDYETYTRVIDAVDGQVKKSIRLHIHD